VKSDDLPDFPGNATCKSVTELSTPGYRSRSAVREVETSFGFPPERWAHRSGRYREFRLDAVGRPRRPMRRKLPTRSDVKTPECHSRSGSSFWSPCGEVARGRLPFGRSLSTSTGLGIGLFRDGRGREALRIAEDGEAAVQ
jgi:hypothetical protein